MKRKYNYQKIRSNHPYYYQEICDLFGIDISTVHRWRRDGLKVIDEDTSPKIVFGKDLRNYLSNKYRKRKVALSYNEFYCVRCQAARRSINNQITIIVKNERLSEGNHRVHTVGECEKCGLKIRKFSSEKKIKEAIKKGEVIVPHGSSLKWGMDHSTNATLKEEI